MLSTDYTTDDADTNSSSSPSEESGDPFTYQLKAITSSDSDDVSDDESDYPVPPPKTQKIKRQQQKQRSQLPSAFTNRSACGDEKTADARRKRRRVQGNDGIPERTTKKKITEGDKAQKQKFTGIASNSKEEEAPTIGAEAAGAFKRKKIAVENVTTSKDTKKAQKQNVNLAETLNRPSSPQKSVTKASQHWSPKDELAFFNGLISYSKGGKAFPSNMTSVYDYVKPMLDKQFNNSQLYNKFRWGRNKFHSITAKIEVNNYSFQKNEYKFEDPHQGALYELWIQLWGEKDKGGDAHVNHVKHANTVSVDHNGEKKKHPREKKKHVEAQACNASLDCKGKKKNHFEVEEEDTHKIISEEEQNRQEEDREDVPKSKETSLSKRKAGEVQISREMYNLFCEERDAALNELKNVVQKVFNDTNSEIKAMLEGHFH